LQTEFDGLDGFGRFGRFRLRFIVRREARIKTLAHSGVTFTRGIQKGGAFFRRHRNCRSKKGFFLLLR
jgi:hypothetical protein